MLALLSFCGRFQPQETLMKIFLYLYPYQRYVETSIGYPLDLSVGNAKECADAMITYLGDVIQARYRDRDTRIYWLLFSDSLETREGLDTRLAIKSGDCILDAGITWAQLCETEPAQYADPAYVFDQLPEPGSITELWLGGFHATDCVSRIGKYAYEIAGLAGRVTVDEDLTEWGIFKVAERFFYEKWPASGAPDPLPLIREHTYEGLGYTRLERWGDTNSAWANMRRNRLELEPWFVHA
jgi:hypothetical protein